MASIKTIENNYGLLTMQERFSLFQQAVYNRDENEMSKIIAESPKRHLTAPDFCEMPEKIYRQDTLNLLLRLNHCKTFEYFIDSAVKTKDKKESNTFSQAVSMSAYLYTIETDAWNILCDELGLDASFFREVTSVICLPVKMMNIKDKFIRDCAFAEDEASKFLNELFGKPKVSYKVTTLEEKIKFYRENIEPL